MLVGLIQTCIAESVPYYLWDFICTFFFFVQTTELCAKQDTYYREVIVELENRLKETIAGRDHVLALR